MNITQEQHQELYEVFAASPIDDVKKQAFYKRWNETGLTQDLVQDIYNELDIIETSATDQLETLYDEGISEQVALIEKQIDEHPELLKDKDFMKGLIEFQLESVDEELVSA